MTIDRPITEGFTTEITFPEAPLRSSIYQPKIYPRSYTQFFPQGNSACMHPMDNACIPVSSGKLSPNQLYLLVDQTTALYGKATVEFFYCADLFRKYKFNENGGQKSFWEMTCHSMAVPVPGLSRDEVIATLETVAQMATVVSHLVADYFAFTPAEIHAMFLKDRSPETYLPQHISKVCDGKGITTAETIGYTCFIQPPKGPVHGKNHAKNQKKKLKQQAKLAATAALPS